MGLPGLHLTAIRKIIHAVRHDLPARILGEKRMAMREFRRTFGFKPDLDNPRSMAEKLLWLKFHTAADLRVLADSQDQICRIIQQKYGEELSASPEGTTGSSLRLHFFDGKLQFVEHISGEGKRAYHAFLTPSWETLPFQWVSAGEHLPIRERTDAPRPAGLDETIRQATLIASLFGPYVRVDFLEEDAALRFDGVDLYNGNGMKLFYPPSAEQEYVALLDVQRRSQR